MITFLRKRLVFSLFVLLGISLITFTVSRIIPSSPEAMWIGSKPTQEQLDEARRELGLDKPLPVQYLSYVGGMVKGDLGVSLRTRRNVTEELGRRWAATFELVSVAIFGALILGIPIGVVSAVKKDRALDHASRAFSLSGVAMPVFWLGMVLQIALHGMLGWFPLQGRIASDVLINNPIEPITGFFLFDSLVTGNWAAFKSAALHIALPALTLSFASLAVVTRMARSSMLEVLKEDYIQTARAYGIGKHTLLYKYALKNALVPTLTVVGLTYGLLLGGSFMVESIFDWPGLGRYAVLSITTNDFPAVMGVTILFALTYICVNTAVDIAYFFADPRIKRPSSES
jgi:peptide/nickel transport system permease protein